MDNFQVHKEQVQVARQCATYKASAGIEVEAEYKFILEVQIDTIDRC